MDTANVKAGLTRKIGPLPLWAWGAVVIGGIVAARLLTGKGLGGGTGGVSAEFPTAPAGDGGGGSTGQGATGSGESVGGGTSTSGGGTSGTSGAAGAGSAAGGTAGATAGSVDADTALAQPIATPTGEVFTPITPPAASAPAGPGAVVVAQPTASPSYIGGGGTSSGSPVSQKPSAGTVYVAPFVSSSPIKHVAGTGQLIGDNDAASAQAGRGGGVVGKAAAAAIERKRREQELAAEQERKRQAAIAAARKREEAAKAEAERKRREAAAAQEAARRRSGTGTGQLA